jgi:serine/threonine-protein kinase RsbW
MAAKASVVEVVLESDLKNVEVAEEVTRRVSSTAGFDEDDQHKIDMAVHESVINAIWHGNKNDPSKHIWLRFEIFSDRLEIRVRDQGNGYDPSNLPDPLSTDNLLNVSGRGIFLIRTFMDDFRVESRVGQGTEVVLVKRLNSNNSARQGGKDREHESDIAPD